MGKNRRELSEKKPDKSDLIDNEKIKNALTHDDLARATMTILSMAYLIGEELQKTVSPDSLSFKAKYAVLQTHNWINYFINVLNSADGKLSYDPSYFPYSIHTVDDNYEKRLVEMVVGLYEELKKDGKIPS